MDFWTLLNYCGLFLVGLQVLLLAVWAVIYVIGSYIGWRYRRNGNRYEW